MSDGGAGPIAFVLSAPSGAGKTTLAAKLLERTDGLERTISWTTRRPREGERDGHDYTFVEPQAFERGEREGGFLESAVVHGNRYGTPRSELERIAAAGHDALMVIDVQGADMVRERLPGVVTVFVLPPSRSELEARLDRREGGDPEAEARIHRRLGVAADEIEQFVRYDYIVINDEIEAAVGELQAIVGAERCRRERRSAVAREILQSFR